MKKLKSFIILLSAMLILAFVPSLINAAGSMRHGDALVLYIGSNNALIKGVNRQVDQANPEVTTVLKDNRAFLPVRFISEAFGASVDWNQAEQRVTIAQGGYNASFTIGNARMETAGKAYMLDTAPFIKNDRTYLPLRALGEVMHKEVFYDRGLVILSDIKDIYDTGADRDTLDGLINELNNLPVVGSLERFKELMANNNGGMVYTAMDSRMALGGATAQKSALNEAAAPAMANATDAGAAADYSKTNTQVQGVDEADIVKTDGNYIYKLNNNGLVIVSSEPATMQIVSQIKYDADSFSPIEMYVDANSLTVIGHYNQFNPYVKDTATPNVQGKMIARPYIRSNNGVKAIVYDITDKKAPKNIREVELEGNYNTSRRIGSCIYLISNTYAYYYAETKEADITPKFKDSTIGSQLQTVSFKNIRYFPNFISPNYMLVAGINLSLPTQPVSVATYLGGSNNVYVSAENMYITTQQQYRGIRADDTATMDVYKLSLKDGKTVFLNKGQVPGTVLNQFSMDEYNGYFRIATTSYNQKGQTNNLYILDQGMSITGSIEDIAPGERIYSVRFMGERGYMVTFLQVDPLFAIDLKDPKAPKILGKLKIPGYSDYLHPYDQNHLLGVGKDTFVTKDGRALYLGLKMAIFDITDMENPKEMYVEKIGDRGTESPLLHNHKALLFNKETGLFVLPVTVMDAGNNKYDQSGNPAYGQFAFQGAYVYNLNLSDGFKLRGKITHISPESMLKSGSYSADYNMQIDRALYIGNNLYTLSNSFIYSNDIKTLNKNGMVDLTK